MDCTTASQGGYAGFYVCRLSRPGAYTPYLPLVIQHPSQSTNDVWGQLVRI
jgi:hypothetical protein